MVLGWLGGGVELASAVDDEADDRWAAVGELGVALEQADLAAHLGELGPNCREPSEPSVGNEVGLTFANRAERHKPHSWATVLSRGNPPGEPATSWRLRWRT